MTEEQRKMFLNKPLGYIGIVTVILLMFHLVSFIVIYAYGGIFFDWNPRLKFQEFLGFYQEDGTVSAIMNAVEARYGEPVSRLVRFAIEASLWISVGSFLSFFAWSLMIVVLFLMGYRLEFRVAEGASYKWGKLILVQIFTSCAILAAMYNSPISGSTEDDYRLAVQLETIGGFAMIFRLELYIVTWIISSMLLSLHLVMTTYYYFSYKR